MAKKVKVSELVQHFQLEVVSGQEGLKRPITVDDLNRPGLEMAGYFEYYPEERVQLLGKTELAFFSMLPEEERKSRIRGICNDNTPCIVITRALDVPQELIEISNERDCLCCAARWRLLFSRAD